MKKCLPIILFVMLILSSCAPKELERLKVPISWGMRLNDLEDAKEIGPNLASIRELGMRNISIELPLVADSAGFPSIPTHIPSETPGLLLRFKVKFNLIISTTNKESLFPEAAVMSPKEWFAILEQEVKKELGNLKIYMPSRVIIGSDLKPSFEYFDEWKTLLQNLRNSFPNVKFSIGGRAEEMQKSGLAEISDEFAIDYPPLVGENLKAQSRDQNSEIAAMAKGIGKSIYIYRANIIGPSPLIQIQNRLRFWPENLEINGICINTLAGKVAARDSKTYYGLADNEDAIDYLKYYKLKGQD